MVVLLVGNEYLGYRLDVLDMEVLVESGVLGPLSGNQQCHDSDDDNCCDDD